MTTNDFTKYDNKWLQYANSITGNLSNAKDLVQELYIKLLSIEDKRGNLDHLNYNGEPNQSWVFVTMKNMFIDAKRKKREVTQPITGEYISNNDYDYVAADEEIEALYEIIKDMNSKDITRYECQYLLLYVGSEKSLRQLAEDAGTTIWVINNAIKNAKRKFRERFESRGFRTPKNDRTQ